jgi:muconate cycloisomerase
LTRAARIDLFTVELPFRFSFGHALAERRSSTSVVVRLELDDGTVGWGESVPREYVTGETVESALAALRERLAPALLEREAGGVDDVPAAVEPLRGNAARCALELAWLDACGRRFGVSVQRWLDGEPAPHVCYDAVVPFSSRRKLMVVAAAIRALGLRHVKIKVGADLDEDVRTLTTLRRLLGPRADLRVDANCAWTADEALHALERLRAARISCVEQPVPAGDAAGLARVTEAVPEAVVVDESLRSVDEAAALVERRACDGFNIRVSKCGGLLESSRIARIAGGAGLFCVVGAQVGESGILSAAGRHLAASIGARYVEGSAGRLLLRDDLTQERIVPGRRGRAPTFTGPGLGVTVDEGAVRRLGTHVASLTAAPAGVR